MWCKLGAANDVAQAMQCNPSAAMYEAMWSQRTDLAGVSHVVQATRCNLCGCELCGAVYAVR
eukprot:3516249-Pyramimonas_sp.AAC.1